MSLTKINESLVYLKSIHPSNPKLGIVLGSGLGIYVDHIEQKTIIPYKDIPHFKKTSVEGHAGALIFGKVHGVEVVALQGRFHPYEGHTMEEIVHPIRVFKALGVQSVILTNASGGINADFHPGDLVAISDHINLSGKNPLVGPNLNEIGVRFPDMSEAYNEELREVIIASAKKVGATIKAGVYCSVLGPSYETPAEIRMLKILGADLVGMSTVPEVIAAHHAGLKVAAVACVTNYAAGIKKEKLSHDDVKKVAEKAMLGFANILTETILELKKRGLV